ncbi:hypothetical protein AbraIFM66951_005227 [Aspergillus brasiliensis]|uniref:Uncharacterized protein n=1 Tax=Aspergillus brasiliensis TaxID=319629 RepID=A0A9W5YT34_9EURO|nr:hypothetical protein AbraCBS73388_007468 [Aspergillus brasiliensis]GKZ43751.1 hypothetical protein AbraIFM66951_005227 [Aspergillus brasiliensis]
MWLLGKLTLATMLVASQAADINTQFWVEKATGPVTRSGQSGDLDGSCAPYMDVLGDLYLEAIDMAEVALEALNNYASNPVIRATLQTYMGIKPDGTGVSAAHTSQFNYSKGAYNKVVAFGNLHYGSNRQPAFFCDGGWRWQTTMEYVDGKQTGRTVSEASVITDKKVIVDGQEKPAYFPNNVAELAKSSVDDAILNADSYAWFATAMYLPAMDWSREIAGAYAGSKISSRTIGNITSYMPEGNGLKRRSDFASPAVQNLEEYEDDAIADYSL